MFHSRTSEKVYCGFGEALSTRESTTSPYRTPRRVNFTGRAREPGGLSHMHYYRNRSYAPSLGIFTSRDAMWADWHRGWGYVHNVPTMYVDPWGRGECKPGEKQCQAADTKAIPLGTGPDLYNATEDLLDGEGFDPVGEWVSDKACRSTDYEAKAEDGFAAYRVNDAGREMKWVRPLPSAVDSKMCPRLELTYRARGLRASDDGGCILWLGDSRKGNWGGFEAVMAREIVADGERHTVHVPLARFNPAGAIDKVLIRVPSGKEGSAVLEVETLTFTHE